VAISEAPLPIDLIQRKDFIGFMPLLYFKLGSPHVGFYITNSSGEPLKSVSRQRYQRHIGAIFWFR
jgi:hypothetical protein